MTPARLLFFTGGTALRDLSVELAASAIDSIHLVTTFDSGGSTATLRAAFAIPAVGDLRNRLLALADPHRVPSDVLKFCEHRLTTSSREEALRELAGIAEGNFWVELPPEFSSALRACLRYFLKRLSPAFDARGACLGNLFLAGSYLEHKRDFGPALALFSGLLRTGGTVLPIVNASLNLAARLENGEFIVGQHHLNKDLPAPIREIFLTVHETESALRADTAPIRCHPEVSPLAREYIGNCDAICYPMGSFYSSVLSNLLPKGVGRAIAQSQAKKIFIPNSGRDPETRDLPLVEQARRILRILRADAPDAQNSDFLRLILVDREHGAYPGDIDRFVERDLTELGIRLVDRPIVNPENPQKHLPAATLHAIMEIVAAERQ